MQYCQKEYWNERYEKENSPFEWFQSYNDLKELIHKFAPKEGRVLHVGCGSSELSINMYDDGWTDIVNIDFSRAIINTMKDRYPNKPGLVFSEMDVEDMSFLPYSFDIVIDKACLDSVLCADGATKHVERMISNIYRVLKPDGVFLMVSTGKSDTRRRLLERPEYDWQVTVEPVAKPALLTLPLDDDFGYHHVYICKKSSSSVIPIELA